MVITLTAITKIQERMWNYKFRGGYFRRREISDLQ